MNILSTKELKKQFGDFKYREGRGGRIIIDEKWIQKNIVVLDLPIVEKTNCHIKIAITLFKIFYEIEKRGLAKEINVDDYRRLGGCFVPRHKCWDVKRSLSRHSWGVAIDFNVGQNPYGKPPIQHPTVVSIFEKFGFYWGGRWATKDGMHFEISDVWQPHTPLILFPEKRFDDTSID